jgi:exodeoxyribonuclease VII large subunit
MPDKIYSVTELTKELKGILEDTFPRIWVEGEISNYLRHSSGHRYFTLKDQNSQLRCVMWRWMGEHLFFEPQDGIKIKASGQITVYEKSGQYQLVVTSMQPVGVGELELAFQQLKQKLADEGLFDPEHKIPIPQFPERIGIVTSPTGAAIRDILNITGRRAPWVRLILWPVKVQGEGAAEQIAHAIQGFNQHDLVDLLIIGRGGGSLEDLWAFNEEVVARAVYESELPLISAVGHEIDFSIADFVADLRAPTPSAAAEIAVPDGDDLLERIEGSLDGMVNSIGRVLQQGRNRLHDMSTRYGFRRPLEIVAQRSQRCDDLSHLLDVHMVHRMQTFQQRSASLVEKLEMVSPRAILQRGYSYARDKAGRAVRSFKQVAIDDRIDVILHEGGLETRITRLDPGSLRDQGKGKGNG